nr:protein FAM114A2 [Onthophagus taurus]
METSDSECFESAGEEFYSDEEKEEDDKKRCKKIDLEKSENCDLNKDGNKNNSKIGTKNVEDIVESPKNINVDPEILDNAKKIINKDEEKESKLTETLNKLEITKKDDEIVLPKIAEHDDNMWDNDDWGNDDVNMPESTKNIDMKRISPQSISLNKCIDKNEEENMWDNDNWSDEEKDDVPKDTKNTKKEEENLWEDNWGDFDEPISKSTKQESQELNSWEDDWEPIENIPKTTSLKTPLNTQEENKKDTGWGSWGNWGLSSVISTATNLTTQVSQSITTVLETGIGAPNPEELAKSDREIEKEVENVSDDELDSQNQEDKSNRFGLGSLVQGVTKLVETTGSKVITGGLDTLETIGKKTMEVLQENDPGLKKKRAFLTLNDDKPILSQMLREAKEKSEQEIDYKKNVVIKRPNYETLFDDYQGLVHLEALEMLSKQCDIKLSNLIEHSHGDSLIETQETLGQIKELCELPEDDEDETLDKDEIKEKIETSVKELNVPICYDKLLLMWDDVETWLDGNAETDNSRDVHQKAVETLAELTAIAVEQFHKGGELLLVKQHRSTADEADSLVQLTVTLAALIGIVSSKFCEKLNRITTEDDKTEVNELITNVFYEAANSTTYIKDAFQLLIPVLQVGAV